MSNILVFVEARDGALKKPSLEALSLGRELASAAGGEVHALLIGSGVEALTPELAKYGATKVHLIDSPELALYSGDGYAAAMDGVLSGCCSKFVLAAHSAMGKDLLPRVAAKQGAGMVSDATSVTFADGELEIIKPVYAGKAFKKLRSSGERFFVSIRPNSYPASESAAAGSIKKGEVPTGPFQAIVKEVLAASGDKVPLAEAQVVIAGGRGLKGPEHWELIENLAAAFGPGVAAVGASRAVCDAGWRPHIEQIGQTGKVVAPTLYIALGISGAIQHLAGMGTSKFIVAVNKDPEAPIFKVANYGIVGDVFEVAPALTEAIRNSKA
ncbi:MAG: electron transfer flavoprotein subunit alpha [Planctomycetota bacterium]|nr:MAG: electron transfer flavoprotein subunit alpha [Planctomycetota bacterium]